MTSGFVRKKCKTISIFVYEKCENPIAIRTSLSPYSKTDGLVDIPLYALSTLKKELAS